jgi:hypothetical protein
VQHGDQARLVFASFLMLFVELALIRWITANNVYVTEATNLVLLASFLGIGIGFLNATSRRDYLRWAPLALLALVAFVLAFPVVLHSGTGPNQFLGVGQAQALPQPVSFALVFLLTVAVMAGLGQGVARIFVRFRPLSAYRLEPPARWRSPRYSSPTWSSRSGSPGWSPRGRRSPLTSSAPWWAGRSSMSP